MAISIDDLKLNHPDIFESLGESFSWKNNFPCLFAIASFNKCLMKFVVVDFKNEIIPSISKALFDFATDFKESQDVMEKTYGTLVLVCREKFDCLSEEENFIENLLIDLRSTDPCYWPEGKTNNPNDHDFEFYWAGLPWFPIIMHNGHREEVRKSKFLTIGFQPGGVFEFNKVNGADFYERMRNAIHGRLKVIYSENLPFYLSDKSSGKNICQYAGFDKKEFDIDYLYPILIQDNIE